MVTFTRSSYGVDVTLDSFDARPEAKRLPGKPNQGLLKAPPPRAGDRWAAVTFQLPSGFALSSGHGEVCRLRSDLGLDSRPPLPPSWSSSLGKEGHYAICKIAEGLLSEGAQASVKKLLPTYAGGNLSALCSWADQIRHNFRWRWTGPLHYIDTPDFACNYGYCRDCHDTAAHKDRCVAGAIYNYSAQLSASPGLNSQHGYNLTEALLFLSHFMGDIHQPLHVGFAGDEGGNTIIVRWFRRKTNLHHVWDTMIIESALKKFHGSDLSSMIQAIRTKYLVDPAAGISSWVNCASNETVCPDTHASESVGLACRYAYRNVTPGATLGDEYFLSRLPLVEKRLAQAGARLAATLNSIFTAGRPPPPISSPIEPLCREWGQS